MRIIAIVESLSRSLSVLLCLASTVEIFACVHACGCTNIVPGDKVATVLSTAAAKRAMDMDGSKRYGNPCNCCGADLCALSPDCFVCL